MRSILHHKVLHHSPDSEWLVFLHGAGGSISTWKRQEDYFANHFNVLLVDLRDHGESKNVFPAHNSYTFEIVSADIKKVLDANNIKHAHFVTLSFGSVLMQDFAARFPSYVQKVIFVGAVFTGGFMLRAFVQLARFFNLFLSYPTMYRWFSYALMPRKENQFARRLYQTQALKIAQDEYMKWLGLYKEFFDTLKRFNRQQLPFPALIVMGATDYLFLRKANQFSYRQAQTELEEIPGVGHIANIEDPDTFNSLALSFLKTKTVPVETPTSRRPYETSLP